MAFEMKVNAGNLGEAMLALAQETKDGKQGTLRFTSSGTGKWGMARLWRLWMQVTADYMAANGAKMPLMTRLDGSWYGSRPFNAEDAHELFTSQWLGLDAEGNRLSWAKQPHDGMVTADKGQRFMAMIQHEEWCINKGIKLPQPRNSEFSELKLSSNGQ